MSWGISPNATEKEKIFADYNDSLMGMNSADGLSYRHYSQIYDIGRNLADKEYQQGRADGYSQAENDYYKQTEKDRQSSYDCGYQQGAREFAEWLCTKPLSIDIANNCFVNKNDFRFDIDNIITECRKEQKMKIFECKCGSTDVFTEQSGNNIGLYCGDCGKWIKWLNKDELRLANRQIENQNAKVRADAIDEYMESLCKKLEECQTGFNMVSMANIWHYSRDIAEQLKENL